MVPVLSHLFHCQVLAYSGVEPRSTLGELEDVAALVGVERALLSRNVRGFRQLELALAVQQRSSRRCANGTRTLAAALRMLDLTLPFIALGVGRVWPWIHPYRLRGRPRPDSSPRLVPGNTVHAVNSMRWLRQPARLHAHMKCRYIAGASRQWLAPSAVHTTAVVLRLFLYACLYVSPVRQ